MIPPPANRLLDSGSFASTFEFRAEDETGPFLELHPLRVPQLRADTRASIQRTVVGFELPAHERALIDPLNVRVRVTMRLADGTRWPCGLFLFASGAGELATTNAVFSGTLYDLGLVLDQPLPYTYGVAPGQLLTDAISWLLVDAGLDAVDVDPSDQRAGQPLNWPAGTTRRQVLAALCELAGYLPPYFTNDGVARARKPYPLELGAGHRYERSSAGSRVIGGDIEEALITAPGAHLVIGSGVSAGAVTGYAEVPFTNPLNPTRRRHTRVEVHRPQGVTDSRHAAAIADGYASRQPTDYRTVSITTVLDPRHDLYEIVDFALPGNPLEPWREAGFAFSCGSPWTMTHTLERSAA